VDASKTANYKRGRLSGYNVPQFGDDEGEGIFSCQTVAFAEKALGEKSRITGGDLDQVRNLSRPHSTKLDI
jgi:hypothetical protein